MLDRNVVSYNYRQIGAWQAENKQTKGAKKAIQYSINEFRKEREQLQKKVHEEKDETRRYRLYRQRSNLLRLSNVFSDERTELESKKLNNKQQIQNAEEFLENFNQDPKMFVFQSAECIRDIILTYENSYPANQDNITRQCLFGLSKGVDAILSDGLFFKPESEKKSWRYKYFLLNGLLWSSLRLLPENYLRLTQDILCVLHAMHISSDDQLSLLTVNEFGKDDDSTTYELFKKRGDFSFSLLLSGEVQYYQKTLSSLETILQSHKNTPIHRLSYHLIDLVKKDVNKPRQRYEAPDYKFYTTVLDLHARILQPGSIKNQQEDLQRYLYLASKANGGPSKHVRIGGIMLLIAGIAVIATSMAISVATLGVVTPIAIYLSAIFGGSCLTVGGSLLFFGRHKGVSKSMFNFAHDALPEQGSTTNRALRRGS